MDTDRLRKRRETDSKKNRRWTYREISKKLTESDRKKIDRQYEKRRKKDRQKNCIYRRNTNQSLDRHDGETKLKKQKIYKFFSLLSE